MINEYSGFLLAYPWLTALGGLLIAIALSYLGARFWVWLIAAVLLFWGLAVPLWAYVVLAAVGLLFGFKPIRRNVVSRPLMKIVDILDFLPSIGDTERVALEAGTSWLEEGILSGSPDFKAMLKESYPDLTEAEREFLEGPVERVCEMTHDWEVFKRKDLSTEVWQYLKDERFLGMVIPEEYGGHGFSANAMNAVVAKLGSRSVPLAVDVMVPNSLGPAELLIHYGTDEQKDHYLPRLARGQEIPAFALTEPGAGSDAASIQSQGTVFEGDDGELYLRLNWEKRYITLATVATVLGLAFQVHDPEDLLGKGEWPGITVGLIPTELEGVSRDRRHNPLHTPFINSPVEGRDVVVSIDQVIGGPEQVGNGWRMLTETLAAGRGIFLPALSTGGAKLASRVTGAYTQVRQQFGLPIGRFEGVEELLAPMGGLTYTVDAMSRFTCGALDEGAKPAVISAIAKYNSSEINRRVLENSMDILGGAGIVLGPRNLIGPGFVAAPIAITVEGSNVVTRSLIVFGQGLIRSHPYAYQELNALENKDVAAFDDAFWGHVGQIVNNLGRVIVLGLSRGRLARSPVGGPTAIYYRKLAWASSVFSLLADLSLVSLGGALKAREKVSGRFADAMSWIFMGMSALRRFEAEGRPEEDLPLVRWSLEHGLGQVQQAFEGVLANFPVPVIGWLLGGPTLFLTRLNPIGSNASDKLGERVAELMQKPGEARDRLTAGIYLPQAADEQLAKVEAAFELALEARPIYGRIRQAMRDGELSGKRPKYLVEQAHEAGILDDEQFDLIQRAEAARREAIAVDDFDLETLPVHMPEEMQPELA